jgi:hypothetical protein
MMPQSSVFKSSKQLSFQEKQSKKFTDIENRSRGLQCKVKPRKSI